MIKTRQLIYLAAVFMIFLVGCKDEFMQDKYKRPDWLAGKLYTQIKDQPSLSVFARCLELTGYDTIINTSGSYTVFAPDNNAFTTFFQNNPAYPSVENIPLEELIRIVKYHIVQNPWSKEQLKSLDIYGWIDTMDIYNDSPRGYKRETLLREKDQKFGVTMSANRIVSIVDTTLSPWYRRNTTDSRKFAPLFYKELFDIYDLNSNDYTFYFNRPFEGSNNMYYMSGKIVQPDIFAENGFIHVIDRVIRPLKNAYQILDTKGNEHSYTRLLNLINEFPSFNYNLEKTFNQPGADLGYEVDSLFDISYPELAFDIINEKTKAPSGAMGLPSGLSIRYHHGLVAPNDEAYNQFETEYFVGPGLWGSLKNAPRHVKRMVANTYMSSTPVYPTNFTNGYLNGEADSVIIEPETIIQQEYGSNCTFIGINQAIVPRAFKSITGPIYLNIGYSISMYTIERAGLLSALKKQNRNYQFFVESDINCRDDSSLIYNPATEQIYGFLISGMSAQRVIFTPNDLRLLILNHVGTAQPNGVARKEFIPNLAGNYLTFNNETGVVSGTSPTTIGYGGTVQVNVIPQQISVNADNGTTYDISNWFSFSATSLFNKISASYPAFHNLLKTAGLTNDNLYRYNFISENEFYTVFVPTAAALGDYQTDTLTLDQLRKFLRMHFVQGNLVFTDGNKQPGYYETSRIDEKSTTFTTVYTRVYIEPGYDVINIRGKSGTPYLTVNESATSNMMCGRTLGDGTGAFPNIVTNGVIHEIDKVLLFSELDTK